MAKKHGRAAKKSGQSKTKQSSQSKTKQDKPSAGGIQDADVKLPVADVAGESSRKKKTDEKEKLVPSSAPDKPDSASSSDPTGSEAADGVNGVRSVTKLHRSIPLAIFSFVIAALLLVITWFWFRYATSWLAILWLLLAVGEIAVGVIMVLPLRFEVKVGADGLSNEGHSGWKLGPNQIADAGVIAGKHPTLWAMPTPDAPKQPSGYTTAALVPKQAKLAPISADLISDVEKELARLGFTSDVAPAALGPAPTKNAIGAAPAQGKLAQSETAASGAHSRAADNKEWLDGSADDAEPYTPRHVFSDPEDDDDFPDDERPTRPMRALTPEVLAELEKSID